MKAASQEWSDIGLALFVSAMMLCLNCTAGDLCLHSPTTCQMSGAAAYLLPRLPLQQLCLHILQFLHGLLDSGEQRATPFD